MADTLTELFAEIAARATLFDEPILAQLCRMAAIEADQKPITLQSVTPTLVGIWDWDVANDLNHLDPNCAELFGMDPAEAKKGLPRSKYLGAVHPDDLPRINRSLSSILAKGGVYEVEYRIIQNDRLKKVHARGFCTLDSSGRPERLPGAIMDVTS
jgi:PAS domain-containing protein